MTVLQAPFRSRLKRLVSFVRRLNDKNFNMAVVVYPVSSDSIWASGAMMRRGIEEPETPCGAVGCLWGWTPAIFPREFKWSPAGHSVVCASTGQYVQFIRSASGWYGLHRSFFYPESYCRGKYPKFSRRHNERQAVLVALRGVLAGGLSSQAAADTVRAYVDSALTGVTKEVV